MVFTKEEVKERRKKRIEEQSAAQAKKVQSFLPKILRPTQAPAPVLQPVFREPEPEVPITQRGGDFTGTPRFIRGEQVSKEEFKSAKEEAKILSEGGRRIPSPEEQARAAELGQQVGQIDPTTGLTETPRDLGEAAAAGITSAIPRALSLAVTAGGGAFAGAKIGVLGGAAAGPGGALAAGAIGAAAGFVAGITSGIISNMRSQRTDNTNAQKRVLDEGKQTLNDWVTLARADPGNRAFYLTQFNIQLSLIQQAHTQMIIDTRGDLFKFENAVPDLAEFEAFYSVGGERDFVVNEMRVALGAPSSVEFDFLSLAQRRANE